jgi:hypothetical protein
MNKTQKYLLEYIARDVIDMISNENNLPINNAMEIFFNSSVFEKLQDLESGLYTESASYVYEMFKSESVV